ncbi:hypothetical protein QNN00_24300 [Bacillus velezensis]|nr:hypothetical protein [Bacillus velezensis]
MAADYILKRSIDYFESEEGKDRLGNMIDDFLNSRGCSAAWCRCSSAIQGRTVSLPELLKFLRNEETKKLLADLLSQEWGKLKSYTLYEADEKWNAKICCSA